MKILAAAAVAAGLLLAPAANAATVVIDFENLGGSPAPNQFSFTTPEGVKVNGFFLGGSNPDFNGSGYNSGWRFTVSVAQGSFEIVSFDASRFSTRAANQSLDFRISTHAQALNDGLGNYLYSFDAHESSKTGLTLADGTPFVEGSTWPARYTSATFTPFGEPFDGVQFDNITLNLFDGPQWGTSVPEPATWAMMIMGFGMAGTAIRRRRSAKPAIG